MIGKNLFEPSSVDNLSFKDSISASNQGKAISVTDMYPNMTVIPGVTNKKVHDANFAFLSTSLAKMHEGLYEPLYWVTYTRDIDIDVGGGFVDYVSYLTVDWAGIQNEFRNLTGNNANYIPRVNAGLNKKTVNVYTFEIAYDLRFVELEKMKQVQIQKSIEDIYQNAIVAGWDLFVQKVVYQGIAGGASLFNHPNVMKFTIDNSAATAANKGFKGMDDTAVVAAFNAIFEYYLSHSNGNLSVLPDRFLVPVFVGSDLSGRMNELYTSTLRKFITDHNLSVDESDGANKVVIESRPILNTMGVGGHGRIVAYKKAKQFERVDMPYPMQHFITLPNIERMGYTSAFVGQVSEVQLPYSTSEDELGPISYWDFTK